ncbi:hypothetical protein P4S70_09055 [Enterovibrio sp. Hal110]
MLKSVTQEARPYTYVLQDLGAVDSADGFYSLSSAQRVKAIDTVKGSVSEWRLPHWEGETNYSFPSGHTILRLALQFSGALFCCLKGIACSRSCWQCGQALWA